MGARFGRLVQGKHGFIYIDHDSINIRPQYFELVSQFYAYKYHQNIPNKHEYDNETGFFRVPNRGIHRYMSELTPVLHWYEEAPIMKYLNQHADHLGLSPVDETVSKAFTDEIVYIHQLRVEEIMSGMSLALLMNEDFVAF